MAVLNPVKLTITNWPSGKVEMTDAINNPEDPSEGTRSVPFSGNLLIEREDFREEAPRKFFRLKKGGAVRLRAGYIVDCHDVVKDSEGNITEILCTYDPETKSGADTSGRKVRGTVHWVSAEHATAVEVRVYDRLFMVKDPSVTEEGQTFLDHLNPNSLTTTTALAEPALAESSVGDRVQFERLGYYIVDSDSTPEKLVFNRIVPLRDTWGKIQAKGKPKRGARQHGKS
jgi:glutaminyl-tRNA synthetase